MSFTAWLAQTLRTDKWVVAPRLTDRLREKGYTIAVPQKRFTTLKVQYSLETDK